MLSMQISCFPDYRHFVPLYEFTVGKWFWAIYLVAAEKGGISALRLSKQIGVSWPTARNMLKMIRTAMAHRDSIYRLGNIIEMDDAVVDGKRPGKSGRSDQGKKRFALP